MPTVDSAPILRYLTPAEPAEPDARFARLDEPILGGLPHRLQLGAVATALLIAPTGLAIDWRDADPAAVVHRSDDQQRPAAAPDAPPATQPDTAEPPARLLVQRPNGSLLGVVPLVTRDRVTLPGGEGPAGPRLELIVLGWDLRAGNLRGPGEFGGRIALSWRRADQAADQFSLPPVPEALRRRLAGMIRLPQASALNVLRLVKSRLLAEIRPSGDVLLHPDETAHALDQPPTGVLTRPLLARLREDVDDLEIQLAAGAAAAPGVAAGVANLDRALTAIAAYLTASANPITTVHVQRHLTKLLADNSVRRVPVGPTRIESEAGSYLLDDRFRFAKGFAR